MENADESDHKNELLQALLPIDAALDDIPAVRISQAAVTDLTHGRPCQLTDVLDTPVEDLELHLAKYEDSAVALVEFREGMLWPTRVFRQKTKSE